MRPQQLTRALEGLQRRVERQAQALANAQRRRGDLDETLQAAERALRAAQDRRHSAQAAPLGELPSLRPLVEAQLRALVLERRAAAQVAEVELEQALAALDLDRRALRRLLARRARLQDPRARP